MISLIIIDDEYEIRVGLRNYFPWNDLGFEVQEIFGNGFDALEFISSHDVEVVLTDIRMPEMDGIELIRRIRSIKPSMRIVVISGFRDFEYAKQCISLGVTEYIVKPTKYEELKHIFSRIANDLKNSEQNENSVEVIDKVRKYINDHLGDVSLVSAAQAVDLNPYYLSTLFHHETNEKFYEYVLRKRIESAKNMLTSSNLPINEISKRVGYSNANSFSRIFRMSTGMTPSQFRERGN